MLASLESIGVVDQWVDGEESTYWLPVLARETLKRDLAEVDIGDVDALHDAVVTRFRDLGLPHLALGQAVAGHRWESAQEILDENGWVLLRAHEAVLRAALRGLPEDVKAASASVRALDDAVALRAPRDRDLLTGRWRSVPSDASARLRLETIGVIGGRRAGVGRETLAATDEVVALAETALDTSGPAHVAAAQLVLEAGITAFASGDVVTAEARLRRVLRSATGASVVAARHEAASFLALISIVLGDVKNAERWRDDALEIRTQVTGFAFTTATIELADTLMSFEAHAQPARQTAMSDFAEAPEVLRLWATYAETRSALGWGGRLQALHRLRASRLVDAARLPDTISLLNVFEADLLLSLGRGTEAARLLETVPQTSLFGTMARARLAFLTGQHDRTIDVLASLTGGSHPYQRLRVEAQLLAALSYHRIGEVDVSRGLLRRVVETASTVGLLSSFSTVPRELLMTHQHDVAGLAEIVARLDALAIRHPYPESIGLIRLTPRESEVLVALSHGFTIDEIAARLFVSRNTVKTQARGLYRKLDASTRSEAIAAGHLLGLLHD
jgi:LuxR family maltose regulon positive regulatory protein